MREVVRLSELISPALSLHLTCTYIFLGSFAAREVRLSELISPLSRSTTCAAYIYFEVASLREVRLLSE